MINNEGVIRKGGAGREGEGRQTLGKMGREMTATKKGGGERKEEGRGV